MARHQHSSWIPHPAFNVSRKSRPFPVLLPEIHESNEIFAFNCYSGLWTVPSLELRRPGFKIAI